MKSAFSLIELLVVIALVAVMVVVGLLVLPGVRAQKDELECASHLRQLYLAHMAYAADHEGRIPIGYEPATPEQQAYYFNYVSVESEFRKYVGERASRIYICPADKSQRRYTSGHSYSSNAVMGTDGASYVHRWQHPSKTFFIADGNRQFIYANANGMDFTRRHRDACNVLYLDGHVAPLKEFPSYENRASNPFWTAGPLK